MITEPIKTDLQNPTTGEVFAVAFGPASGRQRRQLRCADLARETRRTYIREEHAELVAWFTTPEAEREPMSDALHLSNARFTDAWGEICDAHSLSTFRALVDRRGMSSEHLNLIDSAIDGDFWANQEIEPIEVAVERFRTGDRLAG